MRANGLLITLIAAFSLTALGLPASAQRHWQNRGEEQLAKICADQVRFGKMCACVLSGLRDGHFSEDNLLWLSERIRQKGWDSGLIDNNDYDAWNDHLRLSHEQERLMGEFIGVSSNCNVPAVGIGPSPPPSPLPSVTAGDWLFNHDVSYRLRPGGGVSGTFTGQPELTVLGPGQNGWVQISLGPGRVAYIAMSDFTGAAKVGQ